jgi:hypothetical protein
MSLAQVWPKGRLGSTAAVRGARPFWAFNLPPAGAALTLIMPRPRGKLWAHKRTFVLGL